MHPKVIEAIKARKKEVDEIQKRTEETKKELAHLKKDLDEMKNSLRFHIPESLNEETGTITASITLLHPTMLEIKVPEIDFTLIIGAYAEGLCLSKTKKAQKIDPDDFEKTLDKILKEMVSHPLFYLGFSRITQTDEQGKPLIIKTPPKSTDTSGNLIPEERLNNYLVKPKETPQKKVTELQKQNHEHEKLYY